MRCARCCACRCLLILSTVWFCSDATVQAEPLSKATVKAFFVKMANGSLSEDKVRNELEANGLDFQLTERALREIGGDLKPAQRTILQFMKDEVAPLTFNGHGIEIITEEKKEDQGSDDAKRLYEVGWGLPALYKEEVEPGFGNRTFQGKELTLKFFLQNLSTKVDVDYEDVYAEILGVNFLTQPRGTAGMPTKPTMLTDFKLCRRGSFKRKSEVNLLDKSFLRAQSCMVSKHQAGEGTVTLAAGKPVGERRQYQVTISYGCPKDVQTVPAQIFYLRLVIPYDFAGGTRRFVRSDHFFRIYWDHNLIITTYSEEQFLRLLVDREPNGHVIKNSFEPAQVRQAAEQLERTVELANQKGDTSKLPLQSLLALEILGSDKLVTLTEAFIKNYLKVYFPGTCRKDGGCDQVECVDEWCPGERNIRYIQTGTAIPDWGTYFYKPPYFRDSDPRLGLFQFGGGDQAAHFGALFDVLLRAKSPVIDYIRDNKYDITVLKTVLGQRTQLDSH
jgi:hypothetical protein